MALVDIQQSEAALLYTFIDQLPLFFHSRLVRFSHLSSLWSALIKLSTVSRCLCYAVVSLLLLFLSCSIGHSDALAEMGHMALSIELSICCIDHCHSIHYAAVAKSVIRSLIKPFTSTRLSAASPFLLTLLADM